MDKIIDILNKTSNQDPVENIITGVILAIFIWIFQSLYRDYTKKTTAREKKREQILSSLYIAKVKNDYSELSKHLDNVTNNLKEALLNSNDKELIQKEVQRNIDLLLKQHNLNFHPIVNDETSTIFLLLKQFIYWVNPLGFAFITTISIFLLVILFAPIFIIDNTFAGYLSVLLFFSFFINFIFLYHYGEIYIDQIFLKVVNKKVKYLVCINLVFFIISIFIVINTNVYLTIIFFVFSFILNVLNIINNKRVDNQ